MDKIPWIFGDDAPLTIFDTETTGSMASTAKMVEIAAIKLVPERDKSGLLFMPDHYEEFTTLVDPGVSIPSSATKIHGISTEDLEGAPNTLEVLSYFMEWTDGNIITAYNLPFDSTIINCEADRKIKDDLPGVPLWSFCSLAWAQRIINPRKTNSISLVDVTKHLELEVKGAHEALGDVLMSYEIIKYFIGEFIRDFALKEHFKDWIKNPQLLPICTIGREWRGSDWSLVPSYFLTWIIENISSDEEKGADLVYTASHHRYLREGY